jgi:uncharacterized protein YbaR (Trm112 family)
MLRDAVKCTRCNNVYPIEHGFPMMLLDQEMRNRPGDRPSPLAQEMVGKA